MEAYIIDYDDSRNHAYHNAKDKERRLEKHFNSIQADDTLEISQSLETSVKESLARKQALKDEWVSIDEHWLKVAESKDWGKSKSRLDTSKPCKMSITDRKRDALKHYRQRAIKKCKKLGIDYKVEYTQTPRNGKMCYFGGKELFVRRKHLSLFFNERKGCLKISLLKHRQHEAIQKFGVDNNLQEKLEKHNIDYQTFLVRVNKLGWSVERATTTPPKNQNTKRFLKMYPHRAWEIAKPKQRKRNANR